MIIRSARASDHEAVAAFTRNTFDWGDYVPDAFSEWLHDADSRVVVAVDDGDVAVALSRARLLSPREAWFHGARVHPEWRGRGIAGDMARTLGDWADSAGADVARLLVEDRNESSRRHVVKIGFRPVAHFSRCTRPVGEASPLPAGNGGRSASARTAPRPAKSLEAESAFASWSLGELGRLSRGLFARGWSFRRLAAEDLISAARSGNLLEVGPGWALAESTADRLEIGWVDARPEDAEDLIRALVARAPVTGAESLTLWLPTCDWLTRAARRANCAIEPMSVYAIAL